MGIPKTYVLPTGRPFKYWGVIPLEEAFAGRLSLNTIDERGDGPLQWSISKDNAQMFRSSLASGADVDLISEDYRTSALHCAAVSRQLFYLEELLLAGANPNIQNREGETPLHYAVTSRSISFVRLLVESGSDTRITNRNGLSPLDIALGESKVDLVEFLIEHPHRTSRLENGLLLGVRKARPKIVEWALNNGANPNLGIGGGHHDLGTVLDFARRRGNRQIVCLLESVPGNRPE